MQEVGVFIGRFCPLHLGHMHTINYMIDTVGIENSLVLIGSCASPISLRVLFKYQERRKWIKTCYPEIKVCGLPDVDGDDISWFQLLDDIIDNTFPGDKNITFFGGSPEDVTWYYQNHRHVAIVDRNKVNISGTFVRLSLLTGLDIKNLVSPLIYNDISRIFTIRAKELETEIQKIK